MRLRLNTLRIITLLIFVSMLVRLQDLQFGPDAATSRTQIEQVTTRIDYTAPRRGEIFASDGTTLLAASEPVSIVAVQAELLPTKRLERAAVFMRLSSLLPFTDTLTITPTSALKTNPALAGAVAQLVPILPADIDFSPGHAVTLTVPLSQSLAALELGQVYSDVITLNPGADKVLRDADLPPYLLVPVATNVPRPIALALRENSAVLPGIKVVEGFNRTYPQSPQIPSLSHMLGYIGRVTEDDLEQEQAGPPTYLPNDIIGKDGVELEYEAVLRGVLGINQIEVDAFQRTVGEPQVMRPLKNGSNLILNIDLDLQRQSEEILHKWLTIADQRRISLASQNTPIGQKIATYPPITKGVIIVMDVNTGAILASVSLPAYDNSLFTRPLSQADADSIFQNPDAPLFNRAISGHYPPGSTFKQFTAAAALRNGIITPETRFMDLGKLVVRNKYNPDATNTYPNSNSHAYGMINVSDALMVSSNVFFQTVAGGTDYVINLGPNDPTLEDGLGIERLHAMLVNDYGFGQPTGVDLPDEVAGLIPDPEWKRDVQRKTVWSVGDTYITAIGQGDVQVTPLQLLRGTVATATSGKVYEPHIVKAITNYSRTQTTTIEPKIEHQIELDPAYWAVIRDGMRRSVQDPRAYNRAANASNKPAGDILAAIDRFNLAGKTGTAEYAENGVLRSHSWFVGFAPFDNPQVAVLALLEGTGDVGDGSGTLALPAVVDVMRAYFKEPVPDINGSIPAASAPPQPPEEQAQR